MGQMIMKNLELIKIWLVSGQNFTKRKRLQLHLFNFYLQTLAKYCLPRTLTLINKKNQIEVEFGQNRRKNLFNDQP